MPITSTGVKSLFSAVGVTFGKTPLIKLSPKKTVEGFVGAFICTLIFAVLVSLLCLNQTRKKEVTRGTDISYHLFHSGEPSSCDSST